MHFWHKTRSCFGKHPVERLRGRILDIRLLALSRRHVRERRAEAAQFMSPAGAAQNLRP